MIRDFLLEHAAADPVSFHMPGHKGPAIFHRYGYSKFLENIAACDITEIPGADNLFQAEGIIRKTQQKYAALYGADASYLLVNGTSGGIIASVLATVRPGGKLIMARNCHKAVFNALRLGNILPVYAHPQIISEYGIMGAVSPEEIERCLTENPDADAVILPSPNYYGICSDISAIAKIVHDAGKVLIVDQAHGAHLKFFHSFGQGDHMPAAAENCGADLAINSVHKTLASLTQSSVLNLQGGRVDRLELEDRLQMIQSTSPSYILMGFLDLNADLLKDHGADAIRAWRSAIERFYSGAKAVRGLRLITPESSGIASEGMLDRTKILLDMSDLGISGAQLEQELNARGIWPELYAGDLLMFMTGIGNTADDMDRALQALEDIATSTQKESVSSGCPEAECAKKNSGLHSAVPSAGPLHTPPAGKEYVPLESAAGRICAGSVIPYPPGIPLVCPGEEFTRDVIEYIRGLRSAGDKVIGVSESGQVAVGK